MAEIAIGTYIRFQLPGGGTTGYAFQNFHANEARNYGGFDYVYAGFGFSGSSVDLQGSNIRASLVFAVNPLLLNFIQEAADQRWIIRIRTVWLDPANFDETGTFSEEVYQVTGFQHDGSRLSLDLSSPLDAVSGQTPRRVLTQYLVGSLPATGQISFQ
jgi:hypothetical protein